MKNKGITSVSGNAPPVEGRMISGIDLLRGGFALLVLLGHTCEIMDSRGASIPPFFLALFTPATFWVIGFFVLSGFCIGLSVWRSIDEGRYSIPLYVMQRVTRIYPLFLVGLGLAILAWAGNRSPEDAFPALKFASTLACLQRFTGSFPYYGPSWSITYEMAYYLMFPVVLCLCSGRLRNTWWVGGLICFILAGVMGGLWKFVFNQSEALTAFWSIPLHGLTWFGGVLLLVKLAEFRERVGPGLLLGSCVVLFCLSFGVRTVLEVMQASAFVVSFNLPLQLMFFSVLIASSRYWRFCDHHRARKWCHHLGLLSYPLYLFHVAIHGLIEGAERISGIELGPIQAGMIYLVIPLATCWTVGVHLEKVCLGWRRRVLSKARGRFEKTRESLAVDHTG